jgi:Flp pilus assembly protein TadD
MERSARLLVILAALAVILLLLPAKVGDTDVWFHLRAGEWLLGGGGFPKADPFSFTADQPWIDTSWLFQVPLALAHRLAGIAGVTLWNALLVLVAFGGVAASGRKRGIALPELISLIALALLACAPRLAPRPESFSLVFLAIALWLTDRAIAGRTRRLWAIIPLQVVWANSETLFPLGLAVLGAGLLEALRRRQIRGPGARHWALALGGGVAAALINPHGLHGALLPLRMARSVADPNDIFHRGVFELMSAFDPRMPFGSVVFFFLIAAVVLAIAVRERRRLDLFAVLVLTGFGYLALSSVRNIPLFALAGSFIAVRLAGPERVPITHRDEPVSAGAVLRLGLARIGLALAFAFLAVGILTSSFYTGLRLGKRFGLGVDDRVFPTASLDTLRRAGPPPRVMNDHALGHYLIWELRPGTQVFLDGRSEVYRTSTLAAMQSVLAGAEAFDRRAEDAGVRYALLGHRRDFLDPLLTGLASHPRWTIAAWDAAGILFHRDGGPTPSAEPAPASPLVIPAPHARGWLARWFAPVGRDAAEKETAIARVLLVCGRTEDAAAHAWRAVRLAPGNADAFNQLGGSLLRLGRFDEARDALQACLRLDPHYTPSLMNLGVNETAAGRPAAAEAPLRRALALGASEGDVRFQLGRALLAQSRAAEARAEFLQAIRLLPANPKPCLELASLTYHQGQYRQAAEHYLDGARRGETFRGLWGAGVSLLAADAKPEAWEVLVKALDAAPDSASARRVRELLQELRASPAPTPGQ